MPHFQSSNRLRNISYNYSRDNKHNFQAQAARAVETEITRYEEKKRGLVARLKKNGTVDDAAVQDVLGSFTRPWEWM